MQRGRGEGKVKKRKEKKTGLIKWLLRVSTSVLVERKRKKERKSFKPADH